MYGEIIIVDNIMDCFVSTESSVSVYAADTYDTPRVCLGTREEKKK